MQEWMDYARMPLSKRLETAVLHRIRSLKDIRKPEKRVFF